MRALSATLREDDAAGGGIYGAFDSTGRPRGRGCRGLAEGQPRSLRAGKIIVGVAATVGCSDGYVVASLRFASHGTGAFEPPRTAAPGCGMGRNASRTRTELLGCGWGPGRPETQIMASRRSPVAERRWPTGRRSASARPAVQWAEPGKGAWARPIALSAWGLEAGRPFRGLHCGFPRPRRDSRPGNSWRSRVLVPAWCRRSRTRRLVC